MAYLFSGEFMETLKLAIGGTILAAMVWITFKTLSTPSDDNEPSDWLG